MIDNVKLDLEFENFQKDLLSVINKYSIISVGENNSAIILSLGKVLKYFIKESSIDEQVEIKIYKEIFGDKFTIIGLQDNPND